MNCRSALSKAKKAGHQVPADTAPPPTPAEVAQATVDAGGPSAGGGRIEEATRTKLEPLGLDDDPLAVYLLGLARTLDNPGTIAGGSLSAVGREFRETYAAFFRDNEQPAGDAVDAAKDEVARKRAAVASRGAG